ncbi:MAG: antibiotic biosynthesis monooxygenase family protein [Ktedonobacteraceae bacterium]
MPSPVVLINVFEVPVGMENAFVEWWKQCSEALKQEPGFIDANLHRNLKTEAHFQFINVAHWETEESFASARSRNRDIMQSIPAGKGYPMLCEVAEHY